MSERAQELLLDNGYDGAEIITYENFSYDSALIGVSSDFRAVYDYDLMVKYLVDTQGFTMEEAMEWIDYNTLGAHMGENEPIVIHRLIQ